MRESVLFLRSLSRLRSSKRKKLSVLVCWLSLALGGVDPADRKSGAVKNINAQRNNFVCVFCPKSKDHESDSCYLSPAERKNSLKMNNRCFLCYEENCKAILCKKKNLCSICNSKYHGELLHEEREFKNDDLLTARIKQDRVSNNYRGIKSTEINFDSLQKIELKCEDKCIKGILDTGSELTVVKTKLVPEKYRKPCGSVFLTSAFGQRLKASLINLPLCKYDEKSNFKEPIFITCAMVDQLANDLLLSMSAFKELNCIDNEDVLLKCSYVQGVPNDDPSNFNDNYEKKKNSNDVFVAEMDSEDNNKCLTNLHNGELILKDYESANKSDGIEKRIKTTIDYFATISEDVNNDGNLTDLILEENMSDSEKFRIEQKNDTSLKTCWDDAQKGANNFIVIYYFLNHKDKIIGKRVDQLAVPENRRRKLLELAHSSLLWDMDLLNPKTEDSESGKKDTKDEEKVRKAEEFRLEQEREKMKRQEEIIRKQEELKLLHEFQKQEEEKRRLEELKRQQEEERMRQEELIILEEKKCQDELKRLEELRIQEEMRKQEELRKIEERKKEEQCKQEEIKRQEKKEEKRKKEKEGRRKLIEKEQEKLLEIECQKEGLRLKEIEREERFLAEKKDREELEVMKLTELKLRQQGPVWGIQNTQTSNELSLADIQRLQEENEKERQKKLRQQSLQQQTIKQVQQNESSLSWTRRATDCQSAVKPQHKILREEAERLIQLQRTIKPPVTIMVISFLQRFHATITYRKGKEHLNADSLSRLHAHHWKDE